MFNIAMNRSVGCWVAIVVSCTSDGKACILANYWGANLRSTNAAYLFLVLYGDWENPFL
ncbi:unnamed protein product [Penicillium salamii]|nr:unnamed protein product [Penicillium salamii]CAG8208648.1 unnamed protein product [Penicillium salamii]CAG8413243.1 unnamed protein product [Penicillium salamii]